MSGIMEAILAAQQDRTQLNQLISNYLPFIKKQIAGLQGIRLEYDDMLSLAMLTFSGCVQQYAEEKGNFLAFCGVCIRNRLVDESRKQSRHAGKIVPLFDDNREDLVSATADEASLSAYDVEQEQLSLSLEIEEFSEKIKSFGIAFEDLPRICPKQIRSRQLCVALAREVIHTPHLYQEFMVKQRIAQAELSVRFSISPKTIEKHRKYIVTLVLLMDGDYPYIQAFLPNNGEVV